ncbi:inositol monophosphatase [Curtobacterium sp. VKM Ac-2889]|uniref:inositol monophosphatase family protein n=1 Tax=Curtobacterium TaxID=2034 RepID=UPI00188D1768|nr:MULTISPECIES: inositol monophosphatase family protein [Curtobacterium]MBF4597083.1 inositol monophosphatase [Curtobacterium sp. VKM Ac-1796]MBF4609873.1 inositol monophosphatase [Curtobacterium sp. VKM Ac-2889]MCS6573166.1 inositol monophosphatase [Curtobacterium flaccumfaciens pv. flaccumfaciens]MCU0113790.1 inositol monophosphatase [Curtobacterium flaccumfaciens]UXZ56797.1 inositol monophosphatase [Curtobacterium sp. Arg-1]
MASDLTPAQFADLAESIARDAAALAARRRAEGVEVADRKSSIVDVVTAADREVEALIRARIAEARPDDAFHGEESGSASGASGITWVVDPIDGTVNYLYGSDEYGVSIGVVRGGADPMTWEPIAGVVVAPATGTVFRAAAGQGATRDGEPLSVAAPGSLAETLVATGFGYTADRRREQVAVLAGLIGEVRDIRRGGAASLDCCAVGAGTVDAYYERGINPWDMAGGALVAQEAGATIRIWEAGGTRSFLFASPAVADELEALVRRLEAGALGSVPA